MTAIDTILLTDEQIDALDDEQRSWYLDYLQRQNEAWTLTPRQQFAEDLTRECFYVGYGGAAGGGKSDWGLWHIFHYCKKYPRARVLVLRTVKPELQRSLIPRALDKFDHDVAKYKEAKMEWHFTNGSIIEFGFLNEDKDVYQYKSAEYDIVFIDEATETSEFAWRYLGSRIRVTNWRKKMGAWPHMILCTNPGGPGHAWFKENFVTATNHGEHLSTITFKDPLTGTELKDPVTGETITRSSAFVPAYVWDNPHMPEEYRLNLLSLTEVEMRQLLYGDWDVFAGQFFSDWRRAIHVVRPFLIPPEWPRTRALDFGFRNPYCCLWAACDWDSNIYIYRETYEKGRTAPEQARDVVRRSVMADENMRARPEKFVWSNADPAVFRKEGSGQSVAQQWKANGLLTRPAKNDRIGGWSLVRQALRPLQNPDGTPYTEIDPETGAAVPRARIRVFTNCENLIRTIPDQIHDDVNVEDLKKNDDDHALDTLRYLMQGHTRAPVRAVRTAGMTVDEMVWAEVDRIARDNQRGTRAHPVLGSV